jgi:hypothetical protein
MNDFLQLTPIQQNVLIASIIGDGEITKTYKNSRRKNNSYREHFGIDQEEYRKWKVSFFKDLLYITRKSQCVRSSSLQLFTKLYPHFYHEDGSKHIPISLLPYCTMPHFLSVLYMDDGSLCISSRINKRKKKIYLTPHIYLYLQCYPPHELQILQQHISTHFGITFRLSKRPDGQGFILKTTSVKDTFIFFETIASVIHSCPSMYYKTNWKERLKTEEVKWKNKFPDFTILVSNSERMRPYSIEEIQRLTEMKQQGATINEIAKALERSYWSIVYKWKEVKGE